MKRIVLTRCFEAKEVFHVKGNGKTKPGHHFERHDNAVDNTPSAPAEPIEPEGTFKQRLGIHLLKNQFMHNRYFSTFTSTLKHQKNVKMFS
jgi:hypothetical protein